jgi:hypothetical protein
MPFAMQAILETDAIRIKVCGGEVFKIIQLFAFTKPYNSIIAY